MTEWDCEYAQSAETWGRSPLRVIRSAPTSTSFAVSVKQEEKHKLKKAKRLPQSMQVGLLAGLAFINSPRSWASLREIYAFVCKNFVGYVPTKEDWKKSIRHSLCTYDMYGRAEGDGNWMLKDRVSFMEKLDAYAEKNPYVEMYGLYEPHLWDKIRTGTLGLPVNLTGDEEEKAMKKRRAPAGAGPRKRRYTKESPVENQAWIPSPTYGNVPERFFLGTQQAPGVEDQMQLSQPFYYDEFLAIEQRPWKRSCEEEEGSVAVENQPWTPPPVFENVPEQFYFGTQQNPDVEKQMQLSQQFYYAQYQAFQEQLLEAQYLQDPGHYFYYQPTGDQVAPCLQNNYPTEDKLVSF